MINYIILVVHLSWFVFCIIAERRLLRARYMGPISTAIAFSFLPYFLSKCGIVEYSNSDVIAPDLLLLSANVVLGIVGLGIYLLLGFPGCSGCLRLDYFRSVGYWERREFDLIYNLLVFFFILSIYQTCSLMFGYGIGSLLADAAEFHVWVLQRTSANSYFENALMILGGAGPLCLAPAFIVWTWRSLSRGRKFVGICMVGYSLLMSLFFSRAILVMIAVPIVLLLLFSGVVRLSRSYRTYVIAFSCFAAFSFVTIRRASYLGAESGYALLSYFGIQHSIFPDWFMQTRVGQVVLTLITYITSPFSNLSNIMRNEGELAYAYGMMSMRVINPMVSVFSSEYGELQRRAVAENTELLIVSSPGGGQWSMAYGAAFLDLGWFGVYLYAAIIGVILSFSVKVASESGPAMRFVILYLIYFIAFTMFQMPFLAAHHGVFFALMLGLVIFIGRGRSVAR